MSADNYYVVRKHPRGGFALVMGFMSDDHPDLSVEVDQESFPTVAAAIEEYDNGQDWDNVSGYPKYYAEYGLSVHAECDMLEGHTHCPTCKQELPKE
jgi:hypothetical protein